MGRLARVLLVEDSRAFARMAAHAVQSHLGLPVSTAGTLAEAGRILDTLGDQRVLVVTGLSLADGSDVDVVRFFTERGKSVVVVTGMFDETIRQRILAMPVIDYLLKDSPTCIEHLVDLVRRLERNRSYTALVVDDSRATRQQVAALLALHRFHVIEAADGVEGLQRVSAHPEIRLVVTDFAMPNLDGVEMVRRIRQTRPKDELAILGISGSDSFTSKGLLSARFLKNGANDFLMKPFEREEFHCRIEQNVSALEIMGRLRDMATKDFLTGLANRRHFFAQALPIFAKGAPVTAAMMDIDYFKKVNDVHGHDAGDNVLKAVAQSLVQSMRPGDLVARFGGEEFCILAKDLPTDEAAPYFETLRANVAALDIPVPASASASASASACTSTNATPAGNIPITASIGVATGRTVNLDSLINAADGALYRAKTGGRNRVEFVTPGC